MIHHNIEFDTSTPLALDSFIPRGPRTSRMSLGDSNQASPATSVNNNNNATVDSNGNQPSLQPLHSARDSLGSSSLAAASPSSECINSEDTVRVIVRIRPLSDREESTAATSSAITSNSTAVSSPFSIVHAQGDSTVVLEDPTRPEPYAVTVDQVLDAESTQECMTHTMLGDLGRGNDGTNRLSPGCGLIPRVFEALFAAIAEREQMQRCTTAGTLRYSVKCSFLEIYNEEVTDLLAPSSTGLQIRDGDLKKGVYVQGLSETEVLNADDVLTLIAAGSENRQMAATRMNERSSRSHSVFTATIESHERTPAGVLHVRFSKMNLIDLAGSERVGKSCAHGQQLTEAKSINKSLAVLGRVISALAERQRRPSVHIPYRDSRLTFLLQESLGGNSRTCIVANVTPAADSASETYSTLAFASGAKNIRCRAVVNEDRSGDSRALAAENARLGKLVQEMQQQVEQSQALFDQNNIAITSMRAEQGVLKRELNEAKATANRLGDEAAQLRADNAMLNASVAAEEVERERILQELRNARETATREGENARRASEELFTLKEDLTSARAAAAEVASEVADARAARATAEALLEESRAEVRRVQKEAREESIAAASREEGLLREAQISKQKTEELAAEVEKLKNQLLGEHSSVIRYKRMVGEIGRLVDWAQASAPGGPSAAAAAAAMAVARSDINGAPKPSPAALAALRVARMSLGGGEGGHNVVTAGSVPVIPFGDATNSRPRNARGGVLRNKITGSVLLGDAGGAVPRPFSAT
ncbi:hypothetical protein Ndes2526A_g02226 [Nannochloris sp. 'desiccata']